MIEKRIFVSSVVKGFGEQRAAAKAAIEVLRMRAVMCEDFGAQPHSSQHACLEGVKESDAVVLVLGARYGFVAKSGKSVTEEEFDCARERGMPVLVFLEKTDLETAQAEFVQRLKSYEEGYNMAFFASATELKDHVIRGLHDQFGGGAKPALDLAGAKAHLDRCGWGARPARDNGPWLGAVVLPARQQRYVSHLTLGKKAFQDSVHQATMFGGAAIFDTDHAVKRRDTEDSVVFEQQGERNTLLASLEVRSDGTLVFGKFLGQPFRDSRSFVRGFVIDEAEFDVSLGKFLRFANAFYSTLEETRALGAFYLGGTLSGIANKSFGRMQEPLPNSMTMRTHNFPDPLQFPREPRGLARPELVDGNGVAAEVTEQVARLFRVAGSYYTGKEVRF